MSEYVVRLRYYPGDPLKAIEENDLKELAREYGLSIGYQKIEHRQRQGELLMENTMDKPLEDISQEVITVSGNLEAPFSDGIKALYQRYRCPRTVYSLLGSNQAGQKIAKDLMDIHGGW
jgi:hypothetical protein